MKRPLSDTNAALPPTKRFSSASLANTNRVHRRIVLCDYGKPIYKASSPKALLSALEGCVEGHEILHKAGLLHRDISINNLMVNEDDRNPSWRAFLIDLDLAVREQREGASGAKGKTGTRAFMAIGALIGEQHSFMHDLESFFWVILWLCIHYNGPGQSRVVPGFDKWNTAPLNELATLKLGTVMNVPFFTKVITENFTAYYMPMVPVISKLRKAVFPRGQPWAQEDESLYSQFREILRSGREDLN
uniref:EKC/KEOPS complex subunit BUD32 n=1 Tax=Bionectria ochroleuca TaxID=29856 RepID=A0A8H7TVW9_BIOOC